MLSIRVPSETLYGDSIVLVCSSVPLPPEYASRAHIEWWGPNGTSLEGMDEIAVSAKSSDRVFTRSLAIYNLRGSMDGIYSCQFSIQYMNESYTETKTYNLTVSGKQM